MTKFDRGLLTPKQDRSAQRIKRILDAAEALVAEGGAAALTMRELGRRSSTPQGSLYQYVASPKAVLLALAERYAKGIETALQDAVGVGQTGDVDTPERFAARIMPIVEKAIASMPAYHELRLAMARDDQAKAIDDRLDRVAIALLKPAIARISVNKNDTEIDRLARAVLEIGDAMLSRPNRTGGRDELLEDAEWAIAGYLRMATEASR